MAKGDLKTRIYGFLLSEYMLYAIAISIFVGLYYARAAVSFGSGALGVVTLAVLLDPIRRKALWKDKSTLSLVAVILVFVLSGINSANTSQWLQVLNNNLPYLLIPAGVWAYGPLNKHRFGRLAGIFIAISAFSAVLVLGEYALNFAEYNERYEVGKTMVTPIRHIRYSLFIALAALLSGGLLLDKAYSGKVERNVIALLGLFLVVAVHLLAVRTGLLTLYGGLMTMLLFIVIREGKWKFAVGSLAVIAVLAVAAIQFLPSIQNKIAYMRYDLNQMSDGNINTNYSDNIRIVSIMHGIALWRENPLLGVGVGDIDEEMEARYNALTPQMPQEHRHTPISQYVYWLSALGLLGTILFFVLVFYPVAINWRYCYVLVAVYGGVFASVIGETSIQLQLGKTLFVFLACLSLGFCRYKMTR